MVLIKGSSTNGAETTGIDLASLTTRLRPPRIRQYSSIFLVSAAEITSAAMPLHTSDLAPRSLRSTSSVQTNRGLLSLSVPLVLLPAHKLKATSPDKRMTITHSLTVGMRSTIAIIVPNRPPQRQNSK
jgi:NAD-dependent oxidoreductase involved in siderophore biosynthesis